METIKRYINTLPRKHLNTNKISVVLYDKEMDYYLYVFKINLNDNNCIVMNSPSKKYMDYCFIELTSFDLNQLDDFNYEIIENHPYIGFNYKDIKEIL